MASSDSEAAVDHPPETTSLLDHFAALQDPRQRVKVLYPLPEVLLLVLSAGVAHVEYAQDDRVAAEDAKPFQPDTDSRI